MAVAIVALQRHEQIAFLQGAGVDGNAVHGKGAAGLPQRGRFGFSWRSTASCRAPSQSEGRVDRLLAVGKWIALRPSHIGRSHGPCRPAPAHRPSPDPRRQRGWPAARSPISRAPGAAAKISLRMVAAIFAAGIVVGDDHIVGQLHRDGAHQRPLALVAVAAAAEHDMQAVRRCAGATPPAFFPASPACGHNRHRSARRFGEGDLLHPARRAFEMLQRRKHLRGVSRQARSPDPPRPARWTPGSRRPAAARHDKSCPGIMQGQRLGAAPVLAAVQMDGLALAADRDQVKAARPGRVDEAFGMRGIGIDHRHAAVLHHFA